MARYNGDGTLDGTFHNNGTLTTDFAGGADKAYAVAIQPDGKILVAGYATVSGKSEFAVARYNNDGTLDTGFRSTGTVVTPVGSGDGTGKALALATDGTLVLAGYALGVNDQSATTIDFAAARYTASDSAWDLTPDAFTFTDVAQVVVPGEVETSDTVTVAGLDTGVHVPVLVTGGEYAINGSTAYSSQPGWVQNGDTLNVRHTAVAGDNNTTLTVGGLMAPNNNVAVLGATASDTFSSTALSSGGGGGLDILSLVLLAGVYIRGRSLRFLHETRNV